ncbi:MAG TPA: hypothetical protein VM870_10470, partial [Pyrinomonadaceae bacterium]|nr:hypothetical protein [Pyrinomonadaceae bacterium]
VTVEDDVVHPEMLALAGATGVEEVGAAAIETARQTSSAEMRIHPAAIRNDGEPGVTPEAANARRARSITTIQEAADTRFGVTPHVERLRQASTVVLDEAADDPEVRFLLVAVFLFVIFVVVLIVTSIIK